MSHFCFTHNNYTDHDVYRYRKLFKDGKCTYIRWNYEVGEEKGTPHLQGYIQFGKRKTHKRAIELLKGANVIPCSGSSEQNYNYTNKAETRIKDPEEYGTLMKIEAKHAGSRTDLKRIKDRILKGDRPNDVVKEDVNNLTQLQYLQKLISHIDAMPRVGQEVRYYYGPSGVGKTRTAYAELSQLGRVYKYSGDGKFWNAYNGEEYIIIDDIDGNMFDKKELLRILDIYPHYVNVKNGHRALNTKIIIMTADDELKNVFGALCERDYKQLERRIKIIRKFE